MLRTDIRPWHVHCAATSFAERKLPRPLIHMPALWLSCDVSADSSHHSPYVLSLLALLLAQIWLNFKQEILKTAVCSRGVHRWSFNWPLMYIIIALEGTMHPLVMATFTPCMWRVLCGSLAGVTDQDRRWNTDRHILDAILVIFGTAHLNITVKVWRLYFGCQTQTDRHRHIL